MMWLVIAILAVPLIEIGLFVEIGGAIGLWATLAWVLLSGALGVLVIRREGMHRASDLRRGLDAIDPLSPMVHGFLRLIAGVLLILPGFLTDAMGILLLLPPVRALVVAALARRVTIRRTEFQAGFAGARREPHRPDPGIIDGEFSEIDPDRTAVGGSDHDTPAKGPRRPSGWTVDG